MTGSLLLAIDTAGERCSAALFDMASRDVVARADPRIGRGHAEVLMDTIGTVMRAAGAEWADVGKLAVGIGPGSFTGIRVAVAAARGLELSLRIPSVGVSTLEALAEPWWGERAVLSVHDAKRGEVYAALFDRKGTVLREPEALTPDALVEFASAAPDGFALVGSGAAIVRESLDERGSGILSDEGCADIAAIARIGAGRMPGAPPMPLYLRGADARAQASPGLRAAISV